MEIRQTEIKKLLHYSTWFITAITIANTVDVGKNVDEVYRYSITKNPLVRVKRCVRLFY